MQSFNTTVVSNDVFVFSDKDETVDRPLTTLSQGKVQGHRVDLPKLKTQIIQKNVDLQMCSTVRFGPLMWPKASTIDIGDCN